MNFWQDLRTAMAAIAWTIWTIIARVWDWLPQNITTISGVLGVALTIIIVRNQLQLYEKTRIEIELLKNKINIDNE